jgi:hypothetical protein
LYIDLILIAFGLFNRAWSFGNIPVVFLACQVTVMSIWVTAPASSSGAEYQSQRRVDGSIGTDVLEYAPAGPSEDIRASVIPRFYA